MVIIYGQRAYGRVDASGTEHAHTNFVHVYYMPIIPTGSFWVTDQVGAQKMGFTIPLHGRSVLATYLRFWAPIAAIIALSAAPLVIGLPVAVTLAIASAWAWSWRALRGEHALRRSDFNRLAYGMRCEPTVMSPEVRAQVGANLRTRWERLEPAHAPDDVARFGAKDAGEAVIAYGLLRLAALEGGGRADDAAADRILHGTHDARPSEHGPYRDAAADAPVDVHAQIAAAASSLEAQRAGQAQATTAAIAAHRRAQAPRTRAKRMIVASLVVGAIAAGGLIENAGALCGAHETAIADLSTEPGKAEFVTVTCDDTVNRGRFVDGTSARRHVFLCESGARAVEVLGPTDVEELPVVVTGRLERPKYNDYRWFNDASNRMGVAPVYIIAGSATEKRIEAGIALGVALGALTLLGFGVRGLRRARLAAA